MKHNKKSDQLFLERMMKVAEQGLYDMLLSFVMYNL